MHTDRPGCLATIAARASERRRGDAERRRSTTHAGDRTFDTTRTAGQAVWLPAPRHSGEDVGATPTRTILIELKGDAAGVPDAAVLGPIIDR